MRYPLLAAIALIIGGVAAWQAEQRAARELRLLLRTAAVQLAPWGELSHGKASGHFWRSGSVEDLRFLPSPALRATLGWRGSEALHIPMLRYRDLQPGTPWPTALAITALEMTLPLEAPWPDKADLTLRWHYDAPNQTLHAEAAVDAPAAAAVDAAFDLRLARPMQLAQATLLNGRLTYRDRGLAEGERAALRLEAGAAPESGDAMFAERLARWLAKQGLPADATMTDALRDFATTPSKLTLTADPPGALRPDSLGQFAPGDRIAALGLSLDTR